MSSATPFHLCRMETETGTVTYVTVVPPEVAFAQGFRGEAIVGEMTESPGLSGTIIPDHFLPNASFVDVLQEVIAHQGPAQPGLRAEAAQLGQGHVFVIDQRTPTPEGPVLPEDILGYFAVRDGVVVAEAYTANPNYRLLTVHGFVRLDSALHAALVRRVTARLTGSR